MSKFGELIDDKKPLLLVFFENNTQPSKEFHSSLRDVAAVTGDQGKVIKIQVSKNIKLTEALRIKAIPTLMIYKNGEMVWRQSGEQDANTLISLINDYID